MFLVQFSIYCKLILIRSMSIEILSILCPIFGCKFSKNNYSYKFSFFHIFLSLRIHLEKYYANI